MSRRLLAAATGFATVVAAAGGLVTLGAVGASAATATPPYETSSPTGGPADPNEVGTITFYNSAGSVVTSGQAAANPFVAYSVGSALTRAGDTKAVLAAAQPNPNAIPQTWNKDFLDSYTAYPVTTGPSNIQTLSATGPTNTGVAGGISLDDFINEFPNTSTAAGYQNVYQIRLYTENTAGQISSAYDAADVTYNASTDMWTQVYPAVKTATSTTLTATPSPATAGTTVTLTANETPAVAGSVQFEDGATPIGTPVAVDGTGKATTSTSTLPQGSQSLSAVFTPTDTADYTGSTGTTTLVVNPAATATTTTLSVTGGTTAGTDAMLTANVTGPGTTPNSAGTVSFYDNGSTTPLNGSPVTSTTGTYTLDLPTGFTAGAHSVVAKFTPTSVTTYAASQSGPQAFYTNAAAQSGSPCAQTGSQCTDPQYIQGTIPIGTIVISTPYTQSSPLDLGTLALNSTGTYFTASANFSNITVTDTRSGGLGWTASALATALSDGGSHPNSTINAENVGLTNLAVYTDASHPDSLGVTPNLHSNPAAPGVSPADAGSQGLGGATAHTIADTGTSSGEGSVSLHGVLTLNAPTSTEAGLFKGIVTFTVG